jgi:hypothetical protein
MTASLRGLAVLTVIALALAVALVLDAPRRGAVEDRHLAPGLAIDAIDGLALAGAAPITLARTAAGWQVTAPAAGPADPAVVGDLLAAVAAARWDRAAPEAGDAITGLDRPAHAAVLTGAGGRVTIAIGRPVAGADQVWARANAGPPVLVPAWLASAIGRSVDELRQHELVSVRAPDVTGIELHGPGVALVAAGAPMLGAYPGGRGRLRPALVDELARALVALRAAWFPRAAITMPPDALRVRVLGGAAIADLELGGPCPDHPDLIAATGTAGPVCLDATAVARVRAAALALADPQAAIDPAPLTGRGLAALTWPATATTVAAVGGGFTIAIGSGPAGPADDDAVRAMLAALTTTGAVVARGADAAPAALIARYTDGHEEQLAIVGADRVARAGEPVAIQVGPAALAALRLGADALRDRTLIIDDATGLTTLTVTIGGRRRTAARGAVIGEWTGDLDAARATAAAAVIANLRAQAFAAIDPARPVRARIEATFAAPPVADATPGQHVIELVDRCGARVDGVGVVLDADRCAALTALIR